MKCNFLVHSIRPATLFRESATCSISDEKIHRRVPIFSCSFSTFSRRKRPGSLKFAIVLAVIMSFAHVKEGVRFHFSLKNFFFRLSRWWTPNRRVPGRIECTNLGQILLKTARKQQRYLSKTCILLHFYIRVTGRGDEPLLAVAKTNLRSQVRYVFVPKRHCAPS